MGNCKVYWGGHGCELERGHDSPHVCKCNSVCPEPHPNVVIYGDDAPYQGRKVTNPGPRGPFWIVDNA